MFNRSRIFVIGAVTALSLTAGGGVAVANGAALPGISSAYSDTDIREAYSDAEILQLLLEGTGRAADENPTLVERLNFAEERPKSDPALLAEVIDKYLDFHATFESDVVVPLTSGDPALVESALKSLTSNYFAMLESEYGVELEPEIRAQGPCDSVGARVCVAAYAGAVVNAAVYANVAAATFAVVALVIVPAAVTYLMEEDSADSEIVKTELISEMTRAFAR